jgi:hypothetical protein
MSTKTYYLPIDATTLPVYYGWAAVLPGKYYRNKPIDLQDRYNGYLLITTTKGTTETDCALELILTEDEEKQIIDIDGFPQAYFLAQPLPITRVKAVYFSKESRRDQITTIINLSTAFIDTSNTFVDERMEIAAVPGETDIRNDMARDWSAAIKQYDKYAGGFALMRLSGDDYMNYSENYFSTLSLFNSRIEEELRRAERPVRKDLYKGVFFNQGGRLHGLPAYLSREITEDEIKKSAKESKQTFAKNLLSGIIEVDRLDAIPYILSILYTYGAGEESGKKKIDSLILNNFHGDIKPQYGELISLCYGVNRGYAIFSNKYRYLGKEKVVKFQLNSLLDYYTLESIYQNVFNKINRSGDFSYLDYRRNPIPKDVPADSFVILDQVVSGKRIKVREEEKTVTYEEKEEKPLIVEEPAADKPSLMEENKKLKDLIKEIKKQTNMKKVKALIQQFENKGGAEPTLFGEGDD